VARPIDDPHVRGASETLINLIVRPLRQAQDRLRYLRTNGKIIASVRGDASTSSALGTLRVSNHERNPAN
jgi:hypothetical protein